jgi:hypothetical protein
MPWPPTAASNQLGKVIHGELRLLRGLLRRDPVGNLEPRKGC